MPAGYIDPPTKKKLARLAKAAREAEWERNVAIMEAYEAGISLRTIGRVVDLNHQTVRDIAGRTRDIIEGREPSPYHYPPNPTDPREFMP